MSYKEFPIVSKTEGWDSKTGIDHYYINNKALCNPLNVYHEPFFNPRCTVEILIHIGYIDNIEAKGYCKKYNKLLSDLMRDIRVIQTTLVFGG